MEIGQRIKQERERSKLSQIELAARVGVRQPTISRIESQDATKRREPKLAILRRICSVLGIDLGALG